MLFPREAELQYPLPDNGTNLLALQETLLGCSSKMPSNLIYSLNDAYVVGSRWVSNITGLSSQDSLKYTQTIQGLQWLLLYR